MRQKQNSKHLGQATSHLALLVAACGAICAAGSTAAAQDRASEAVNNEVELITVTARRTEEFLQQTPLSVTAFTAKALQDRNITELEDVALLTPGFTFEDFSGGAFGVPVVRGATQQNITILEQNVSVFVDGIYIPRAYAFDLGIVDMQQIEIVKGPQSALYGQNAFMGAVNYTTKSANADEISLNGELEIGSDNLFEIIGGVNVPLIKEKLALRVSGGYSTFDGTWRNNHPNAAVEIENGTKGNVGGWDRKAFGVQFYAKPIDAVEITGAYRRFDIENETVPLGRINQNVSTTGRDALNCGAIRGSGPTLLCGELQGPTEDDLVVDPRTKGAHSETDLFSLDIGIEVTDTLFLEYRFGDISSEAEQIGLLNDLNVLTPGEEVGLVARPAGNFDYRQHEVRLTYDNDDNIRATIGGFRSSLRDLDRVAAYIPQLRGFLGGEPVPSLGTEPVSFENMHFISTDATTDGEVHAIFASVNVGFMDNRLNVSAEARYSDEKKVITNNRSGLTDTYEDNFFTPRVIVDYKITDDNLIYASAAKGVKAGGLNADPSAFSPLGLIEEERQFGPDVNWTYEIGTKNTFFNGALTLNAAAFYIDWSDMQITAVSTVPPGLGSVPADIPSITLNIGDATIIGFEMDGNVVVNDNLSILFGASYQDATFNDDVVSRRIQTRNLCDDIVCSTDYNVGGNELPRSSPGQAFVGFDWRKDSSSIASGTQLFAHGDVTWQSRQYLEELNLAFISSRTLVNASVGISHDNWSLTFWARNLFDEEYVSSAFYVTQAAVTQGSEYSPFMGARRTFGIALRANY